MSKQYRRRRKPISPTTPGHRVHSVRAKRRQAVSAGVKPELRAANDASPAPQLKVVPDVEPTPEELAAEQTLVDEEIQARRDKTRQSPAPGKDLLASYMDQLSHIPL